MVRTNRRLSPKSPRQTPVVGDSSNHPLRSQSDPRAAASIRRPDGADADQSKAGGLSKMSASPHSRRSASISWVSPHNNSRQSVASGGGGGGGMGGSSVGGGDTAALPRLDSSLGRGGGGGGDVMSPPFCFWGSRSSQVPSIVREGLLKKRGGRINSWADRYFVLREGLLEQFAKGEHASNSEPKHCYELDACCTVSEIKEVKAGGKPVFYFQVEWPSRAVNSSKEGHEDSGRSAHEWDERDSEHGGGHTNTPPSNMPTPLDSPVTAGSNIGNNSKCSMGSSVGSVARGGNGGGGDYGLEDGGGMPMNCPQMERGNSSCSLTGQDIGSKSRRPRSISVDVPERGGSFSPMVAGRRKGAAGAAAGDEDDSNRNETIESMVAAQRGNEERMAMLKHGELKQFEREKIRRREEDKKLKKKKLEKMAIGTQSQAVAATAVGVSWLTATIATGGLVLVGTLVAAGVTVGSVGAYNKYKSIKSHNGSPRRVRLASDKFEVAEQWQKSILEQLEKLLDQPRQGMEASTWMGQGLCLGFPGWSTPPLPEGPPPALKAIDLRVVDDMLANASWTSRSVMSGLQILEQNPDMLAGTCGYGGGGGGGAGWGLGGTGPVLKTQTIVRASPLETFVALMDAPKHSRVAVMSNINQIQSLDDHSDVIRLCLRPAWLKVAWAAPRDFCLARYWHMAEDGCYIVTFSSMEHPDCKVDPAFIRGEAYAVYTISPRRDSVPGGHASPECLLACHVQVDPKGWVLNRLGFRELYASHTLMHVLEVRDVIEAERFMKPRVTLRPDSPASGASVDGRPLPFEVVGPPKPGGVGSSSPGWPASREREYSPPGMGGTSLENSPPPSLERSMWTEADGTQFSVRGPNYLTDRVKVSSAKQMFRLRAVDLFVLPEPATHVARHPSNRVQVARRAGEKSFVWVLQIMVPGPPHYAFICYFTPEDDSWMDQDTPFGKLAKRVFFGDDDGFRDARLKLIPKIVEGNWVVKRAAGTTPAILGTKLKQHHFRGDNYLETDLEIASSSVAANVTRLCTGYAKSLMVDMVWTIQGNTQEELPEVALGGVRIKYLDLPAAQPLDLPSAEAQS